VHHTQLLNRLVREGRLTPVQDGAGAAKRSITYHDPCYIGRHNQVYTPPRELLQVLPGADFVEMERNSERSFCCGAGGARMWMEETIGERINLNRTTEAVGTGADQIAVGCPFCRVMLSDGLAALQDSGDARPEVEVLDVAQMLLASVKGESATRAPAAASASAAAGSPGGTATATLTREDDATKAEPSAGNATQTPGTITETADAGPAAKASGGSSLFDFGGDEPAETTAPEASVAEEAKAAPTGGSLFDVGADTASQEEQKEARTEAVSQANDDSLSGGGSLFDVAGDAPADDTPPTAGPATGASLFDVEPETPASTGGSLFDVKPEESAPKPQASGGSLFDVEPEEAKPAESAPAQPSSEIPRDGSLFDIPAPESTEATEETAPEPSEDAAETTETDDEPDAETDKPKPTGEAHQPKTDVNIDEKGSLFDL
jgi:hypothetical protein